MSLIIRDGLHRSYLKNIRGRDFVIGDIHGDLEGLEIYLDRISFDKSTDRLFCSGDLIDRGVNSYDILMMARDEEWFIPAMGNHELIIYSIIKSNMHRFFGDKITLRDGEEDSNEYLLNFHTNNNGCGWLLDLDMFQVGEVVDVIESLPLSIDITDSDGCLVGIVHTDPMSSWIDVVSLSRSCSHLDLLIGDSTNHSLLQGMLWGRSLPKNYINGDYKYIMDMYNIKGVSKVYVGHTVLTDFVRYSDGKDLRGVHTAGRVVFIDTGAWRYGDGRYPLIEI